MVTAVLDWPWSSSLTCVLLNGSRAKINDYSIYLDLATDVWSDAVVQEIQLAVSPWEIHVPCVGFVLFIPGGVTVQGSHYISFVYICFILLCLRACLATQLFEYCAGKYTIFMYQQGMTSLQTIRRLRFKRYSGTGNAGWGGLYFSK